MYILVYLVDNNLFTCPPYILSASLARSKRQNFSPDMDQMKGNNSEQGPLIQFVGGLNLLGIEEV